MARATRATYDPANTPVARALAGDRQSQQQQWVASRATAARMVASPPSDVMPEAGGAWEASSVGARGLTRGSARPAFVVAPPPRGIAGVACAISQPGTIAVIIPASIMVARPPAIVFSTLVRFSDVDADASGSDMNTDALGCNWGSGDCGGGTQGSEASGHCRILHFRPLVAFGIREVNARRRVWFLPSGPGWSAKAVASRSVHRCRRHFFGGS